MLLSFLIIVFEINIAFIFFFIIRYNSLVVASVIVIASADRSPGMARHQTNLLGVEWNVKACSVTRWMSCIALFKLFVIFFQTVNISLRYKVKYHIVFMLYGLARYKPSRAVSYYVGLLLLFSALVILEYFYAVMCCHFYGSI